MKAIRWYVFALGAILAAGCKQAPRQDPAEEPARTVAESPSEPAPIMIQLEPPRPVVTPAETPAPQQRTGPVEVFPHVRFDAAAGRVEFDGFVPIDCHNPRTPTVYLEVVACVRNTKEHEALVVTDALPSHVHAALLAAGLVPGKPGSWRVQDRKLVTIAPEGPEVTVTIVSRNADGTTTSYLPEEMVLSAADRRRLSDAGGKWLFTGSRIVNFEGRDFYDADGMGTLVGLTTFGAETVAWSHVMSHESAVEEPEWIADAKRVPPFETPVVVVIEAKH